jgi:hypothetical protein
MLQEAYHFRDRIEREMTKISGDPFFDNLHEYVSFKSDIQDTNWSKHQFVSIENEYNIVGYLEASVNRTVRYIDNLVLINFRKTWNPTFARDLKEFVLRLFLRYNYSKINFSVNVNTRNEKIYDKFIYRYGGRVVGTFMKHKILQSGIVVDHKYYEIMREDFIKMVEKRHPQEMEKFDKS